MLFSLATSSLLMGAHALKKERVRDYLIPAPTLKSPEIIYPLDKLGAVKRRSCTDCGLTVRWLRQNIFSWSDSDKGNCTVLDCCRKVVSICTCCTYFQLHKSKAFLSSWENGFCAQRSLFIFHLLCTPSLFPFSTFWLSFPLSF